MNFFFIFPKYDKCNFLNPPLVNMNKTILYMVVVCSGEFANHTIIFSTSSLNLPQVPIRGHNMSRCKHSRSGGDFCLKGRNWWGVMSYFQTCFANFLWTFWEGIQIQVQAFWWIWIPVRWIRIRGSGPFWLDPDPFLDPDPRIQVILCFYWIPGKIWGHLDFWILKIRQGVQKLGIIYY